MNDIEAFVEAQSEKIKEAEARAAERTDAVKQAFQHLMGDEAPVIRWGNPAARKEGDQS